WAGTIRFKWLVRLPSSEMESFLEDPTRWIGGRYGGGKFKMNLHHGLHFVNTRNFKPEGEPQWKESPALDLDAWARAARASDGCAGGCLGSGRRARESP